MNKDECLPLNSFQELLSFVPEIIRPEDNLKIRRTNPYKFENVSENQFELKKCSTGGTPKTLVCHDMKGGYLEDRFRNGCYDVGEEPYRFIHWSLIDTFVYFSHHFITIPPRQWISAAHKNGVQILGTIITEFGPGEVTCAEVLKDESTVDKFVTACVKVASDLCFDGWLVNIENKLGQEQIPLLILLLRRLTAEMRQSNPNSAVIWYDAVTVEGELDWQNELNAKNKIFFDNCDAIFLNYTWKVENLENSIKNLTENSRVNESAENSPIDDQISSGTSEISTKSLKNLTKFDRKADIYVGVDVFGRGCMGGGGFECYQPIKIIREKMLSVAIFAPGWTHECLKRDGERCYPTREYKFWKLIRPYLFLRGPIVDSKSSNFLTYFCPGFGRNLGASESWWLNLNCQDFQPSFLAHPTAEDDKTDLPVEPFNVYCKSDDETKDSGAQQISYKLVVERNSPTIDWKIGQFQNAFPLFVTEIQVSGERRKVEFKLSAKSTIPPDLFIRTHSNTIDCNLPKSESNWSTGSHKYVRITHDEKYAEKVEKSSKFEEFVYTYMTSENDIIDLVCLDVKTGHVELNSFAIEIMDIPDFQKVF